MIAPAFVRAAFVGGLLALAPLGRGGEPSAPSSPFLPPAEGSARATASQPAYEFIGVTTAGARTLVCIRRTSDQHARWIPVGQAEAGIRVTGYDAATDVVTLQLGDTTLTLALRQTTPTTGPAARLPATVTVVAATTLPPPGPGPAKIPLTQEEKELEARMLVTDLLEIGQQQRKAYEQARREAAAQATPPATPSTSPRPPTNASPATAASAPPSRPSDSNASLAEPAPAR